MNTYISIYRLRGGNNPLPSEILSTLERYTDASPRAYTDCPSPLIELFTWELSKPPTDLDKYKLLSQLLPSVRRGECAVYLRGHDSQAIRRIVADLDGCLVAEELLPRLAVGKSYQEEMLRTTLEAMNGAEDFDKSFRQRVSLLRGTEVKALEETAWQIALAPGIELFAHFTEGEDIRLDIASSNLTPYVHHLANRLGASDYIATMPSLGEDEILDGKLIDPIVGAETKRQYANTPPSDRYSRVNTLTIGDGANDLAMLSSTAHALMYSSLGDNPLNLAHLLADLYFRPL